MCDPVTLIAASTAVAAIGSGVTAMQSAASSRYEAKVADRNAQLANQQGRDAAERQQTEAQRLYRRAGQVSGQQRAAMAANGLDLGFGSALQVQQDSAMIAAEDAGQLYKAGNEERRGFDIDAGNFRAKAQGSRQAASAAIVKGVFDVGSTVLGGAKQYNGLQPGRR